MRMKYRSTGALALMLAILLSGCAQAATPTQPTFPETEPPATSAPIATDPLPTQTEIPETIPTEPPTPSLYLPGISVEDVILYFNEVCLDSEFVNSGDPSVVQKWVEPIRYELIGDYTEEDIEVLENCGSWLNSMEGFPGISSCGESDWPNLRIHFCSQEDLVAIMGPDYEYMDGAVTFWYENNQIYDATICIRNDLDRELRNSVILEELYNGLGPIQDTSLREDSIIYQEFSQPQSLTDVDELILQLLYHPDILPGMNALECEQVIRSLYIE